MVKAVYQVLLRVNGTWCLTQEVSGLGKPLGVGSVMTRINVPFPDS